MKARQRRHFSRRLTEERVRLVSTISELEAEAAFDVIEAASDRDALEGSLSDAEAAEAASSVELRELREVDAAMSRLRDDPEAFGRCVVCGKDIGASRLELVPWASRCATHAAAPNDSAMTLGVASPPVLE